MHPKPLAFLDSIFTDIFVSLSIFRLQVLQMKAEVSDMQAVMDKARAAARAAEANAVAVRPVVFMTMESCQGRARANMSW